MKSCSLTFLSFKLVAMATVSLSPLYSFYSYITNLKVVKRALQLYCHLDVQMTENVVIKTSENLPEFMY